MRFNRRSGWSNSYTTSYRSGLEETNGRYLEAAGVPVLFEEATISYEIPSSLHTYTPDFVLPNGIIVETKGLFEPADRKKHQLIQKQYPWLDIRFVFSNPAQKLYKGSPTTYAKWCEKQDFLFAKKLIPSEWLKEPKKDTTGLNPKKGKTPK